MPSLHYTVDQDYLVLISKSLDSSERSTISVGRDSWSVEKCSKRKTTVHSTSKSVRFDLQANSSRDIPSRNELSKQDLSARWYSDDDFKKMKSKQRTALRMMNSGRFDDKNNEDYCYLGIRTKNDKIQRQELQSMICMELVYAPREDYFSHPLATDIAIKIKEISKESVRAAIVRAEEDQQAALEIQRE